MMPECQSLADYKRMIKRMRETLEVADIPDDVLVLAHDVADGWDSSLAPTWEGNEVDLLAEAIARAIMEDRAKSARVGEAA